MTDAGQPLAVAPGEGATIQGPAGGPLTFMDVVGPPLAVSHP